MSGKDQDILAFSDRHNVHVFCILETWNTKGKSAIINNNFINMTKTNTGVITGGKRSTGGILCFAHSSLKRAIRVIYQDPNNNFLMLITQIIDIIS